MSLNAAALELIKLSEGFVDHWYPDPGTSGEPWTCCYGHTAAAGPPAYRAGQKFTTSDGEAILTQDLADTEAMVKKLVKVQLNDNQFGALVSFAFNVGAAGLAGSTLLRRLNAGDPAGAAAEFGRWNHAAGRVLPGLTARRAAERALFLKAVAIPIPASAAPAAPPLPVPPPLPPPPPGFWRSLLAFLISLLTRKV